MTSSCNAPMATRPPSHSPQGFRPAAHRSLV